MIHKKRYDYTRNNHGVFINLTWIPESMLQEMEQYIEFCQRSKTELTKYESLCDVLNSKFNEERNRKDDKDPKMVVPAALRVLQSDTGSSASAGQLAESSQYRGSRVSTSMRFYLLKKRYAKMNTLANNFENDLSPEPYSISTV